jgi:ferric-dicitrate binding protein FerR (iron transport regulator)
LNPSSFQHRTIMSTEQYFFLLDKKRREGLTPDEQQQLDAWLEASETNRALAADIEALFKATEPVIPPVDVHAELAAFKQRLHRETAPAPAVRRRWMWAAAAVATALFAAFWFLRP